MRKQIFSPAVTLAAATHQTARPLPSLPLRGKVAPQGRMRGNLADNALYRAIFPSPPAGREGACPLRRFP